MGKGQAVAGKGLQAGVCKHSAGVYRQGACRNGIGAASRVHRYGADGRGQQVGQSRQQARGCRQRPTGSAQRTVGSMERTAGRGRFVQDVSLPVTSLKGVQQLQGLPDLLRQSFCPAALPRTSPFLAG